MMRLAIMASVLLLAVSCVNEDITKNTNEAPTHEKVVRGDVFWEENSEEDMKIQEAMDNALFKVSWALKRGQIFSMSRRAPMSLVLKANENIIEIYEIKSSPGEFPLRMGQKLESFQLPKEVMLETDRNFWYDDRGNIDFSGEDNVLRVFDNPPRGDILILPKKRDIPRRGIIDITKSGTGAYSHQFILHSSRWSD